MAVEIPVVSLEDCRKKLSHVADDMICGGFKKGSKDSCTGDSGGPYAVDYKLVGVVAWGIGCGREGLPGVYTSVPYYLNWINATIHSDASNSNLIKSDTINAGTNNSENLEIREG